MRYRKFGKLNWDVSVLGFGAMRLPVIGGNAERIDEPEAVRMIRCGIDGGINYVDTAYPYHGGNSEVVVGKALREGYRDKVRIATKLPVWIIESVDHCDRILTEQLKRLNTARIDFYLMHGLNSKTWAAAKKLKVIEWVEKAAADGRIGYAGFSFHDSLSLFKEIIDFYDKWTFCQIQYNYMDIDYQAGTRGLNYAADRGLAVVVMEPLRGGRLAKTPPDTIARIWASAPVSRSHIAWAWRWIWNHKEISVALSGMSTMEQVTENLALAEEAAADIMSADEMALIEGVRKAYNARISIPCTGCGYCMPCPHGVDIPLIFESYNDIQIYDQPQNVQFFYNRMMEPEKRADMCQDCGQCLEVCPQNLDIPRLLKQAHGALKTDDYNKNRPG
jgi:predicted aldo/keto reductase-like oxidoreductase